MTRNTLSGLFLLACAAPGAALAQTAYLEQSGIVGQGTLLTISRVPTAQANGKIGYYDGKISLTVSPTGVPSVTSSSFTKSANLITDHFMPGRYYVKAGSCATQYADLTEGVGHGGSMVWTLVLEQSPNCHGAYPDQAAWQTGAPAPDVAARLNAAKVPNNPDYSYGTTEVGGGTYGPFTASNGLLAAEQVSDDLHVISYTDYDGRDQPGQVGSVTFSLCKDAGCSNAGT